MRPMKKRIVVIKKGMEKKELIEGFCCPAPVITLMR
jgi:hypothetical protein